MGRKPHPYTEGNNVTQKDRAGLRRIYDALRNNTASKNAMRAYPVAVVELLYSAQAMARHVRRWGSVHTRTPWRYRQDLNYYSRELGLTWAAGEGDRIVFKTNDGILMFRVSPEGDVQGMEFQNPYCRNTGYTMGADYIATRRA